MPIHTFICQNPECKHEFDEVFIRFSEVTEEVECPKCKQKAKRIPSLNAKMKANWSTWNLLG